MEKNHNHRAILLTGEGIVQDFLGKHKGEIHTADVWIDLAGRHETPINAECRTFATEDEARAFADGVKAANSPLPAEHRATACIGPERIITAGHKIKLHK